MFPVIAARRGIHASLIENSALCNRIIGLQILVLYERNVDYNVRNLKFRGNF